MLRSIKFYFKKYKHKYFYWLVFLFTIRLLIFCVGKCTVPDHIKRDYGAFIRDRAGISFNTKTILLFNPYKHDNISDVLVSAFHEFQHLQQHLKYGKNIHSLWSSFSQTVNYNLSATELDARRFSFSLGFYKDWIVYDRMNLVLQSSVEQILHVGEKVEKELNIPQELSSLQLLLGFLLQILIRSIFPSRLTTIAL